MNLINNKPCKKDIGNIACDYYLEREKVVGKSLWHNICLSYFRKNEVGSLLLRIVDSSYNYACQMSEMLLEENIYNFIGLYAENGNLIAHTSLHLVPVEEGWSAQIGNIFIKNKELIRSENENSCLKWVYGIYDVIIEYIEKNILSQNSKIINITIVSSNDDEDFLKVVQDRGYEFESSNVLPIERKNFTKVVRERGVVRERRNPNQ